MEHVEFAGASDDLLNLQHPNGKRIRGTHLPERSRTDWMQVGGGLTSAGRKQGYVVTTSHEFLCQHVNDPLRAAISSRWNPDEGRSDLSYPHDGLTCGG
jgi:hypothetical protein